MSKKSNLIKLGDAINQLFRQEKLDIRLSQFAVKNGWKDIVGEVVARNTSEISFNNQTIFVAFSSAAIKHEVSFQKETILQNINKFCGYKLVDTIIIK